MEKFEMDNKTFTIAVIASVAILALAAAIFAFASGINVRVWNWERTRVIDWSRDVDREDEEYDTVPDERRKEKRIRILPFREESNTE